MYYEIHNITKVIFNFTRRLRIKLIMTFFDGAVSDVHYITNCQRYILQLF